jgi:hypothetical protein
MANAATIAAVGIRRDVPERAITVAMATALQESKLRNVPDGEGDRDSVGLFQQRPSQGWGTAAQIADPRYAAGRFYSALLHVKNWQHLTVTAAAQAVQHSAAPYAYQKWAVQAQVLASALMGDDEAAVACNVGATPSTTGPPALSGLATGLRRDWGDLVKSLTTTAPDRLTLSVGDTRVGWQYAHWLVAHAQDNGIQRVQFAGLAWTAQAGEWKAVPTSTATAAVLAASDHSDVVAQVFSR